MCTQEEIRTPTPLPAPAPQAGASTNFATWVFVLQIYIYSQNILNPSYANFTFSGNSFSTSSCNPKL